MHGERSPIHICPPALPPSWTRERWSCPLAPSMPALPPLAPGAGCSGASVHPEWGKQYASLREAGTVGRSGVTQALPGRLKGRGRSGREGSRLLERAAGRRRLRTVDHYSPMNLTKVGSGGERAAEQARTEQSKDQLLPASSKSGLTPQVPGHRQRPGSWVRQELDSKGWQRGRRG